ncbi:DUF3455 domain-containing protein [Aspergillus homomorphus CBS 101889]|uniref:Malate dehydrogenase n=1 Tax=Aspergillus homomorphus (strain CBS 101889) TaxID=1450537 RepID=A0A395I0S7_ASPHC|nr:hypothetical protein BO97DRAFT_404599 [Aspergillus homomorphus CBS 101889]RAL13802.1 hypothetical protein BO97DRAFT_404599 [Aspergillus homomorphus CBS 101889]
MRFQHLLLHLLLVLLDTLYLTTATPLPNDTPSSTTSTVTTITNPGTPNAVHLATSFISLSHALTSQRLTNCPLELIPFNDTTAGTPKDPKHSYESTTAGPNPAHLTPPSAHLDLKFIALGRGTQNYTCPTTRNNSMRVPIATGAVATLYDASCLISSSSSGGAQLLHALPSFTQPISQEVLALYAVLLSREAIIGEHYFSADGVPVFDLHAAWYGKEGGRYEGTWVRTKKVESVVASDAGRDVPWLKLVGVEGKGVEEVYRVHTAGGASPATCAGQKGEFGVEYAAEYWFYG